MANKATIKIPRNLYKNLNKIIEDTGFNSVTEFIVYVMRDLVSTTTMSEVTQEVTQKEEPSEDSSTSSAKEEKLTGEEIEMIRKRLRSLGYLD